MCGVFGISAPGRDVARLTYFGLHAPRQVDGAERPREDVER